jgi:CDP-diacylglycerol--glycerol-3-phosphate 3-phosphatidyltransferase
MCISSDYLDGYIARRYNLESIYGKYLDPVCDKFFTIVSLLLISLYFDFPIFIIYIIIVREILGVIIGTLLFFKNGFQGEPNIYGRLGVILVSINIAYYIGLKALYGNIIMDYNFLLNIPSMLLLIIYLIGMVEYLRSYYYDLVYARRGT